MKTDYFTLENTLYEITEKYPETIPVFASRGFPQIAEKEMREKFGKNLRLGDALSLKQMNPDTFSEFLLEAISGELGEYLAEKGVNPAGVASENIRIEGLLPCPVRIPLTEALEKFIQKHKTGTGNDIRFELKAASMGLDWLKEPLSGEDDESVLADIFISAGFDLFFDDRFMGKFKNRGVFRDLTRFESLHPLFSNRDIDLKDPRGHYSVIGVVPAVFLVNTNELGERKAPESWKDLLAPEFEKSVSLPIGDFDLFNAILLNIFRRYGRDAVSRLGKSLLESMHPSQMVRSERKKSDRPAVTIMPYFFTKMVKGEGPMTAIWPADGAIISPIFMLSKSDREKELKPVVDFFASSEVGEILAHRGLFPSTNPGVDNRIPQGNKFMWIGWDFIYSNDVAAVLKECEDIFNRSAGVRE